MRRTLQIAGLLMLCVALITTLFFSVVAKAAPGINQTISFQGRLLDSQNNVVPDGYYNVQFKIYQDGTGSKANNPDGTLKWTETYINNGGNNGVFVKNGYLAVDLGSKTPFGTSVDWSQDTLWLSMNIAGSSTICTTFGTAPCIADGEMLPMKRLTATPYSLNSAKLQGKSAGDFIQNSTTQQTADFNISGVGIANTLQGTSSLLSPLLDRADAGTLSIGTLNASSIQIGSLTANQTISIGTGTGDTQVAIGSTSGNSGVLIEGGNQGVNIATTGDFGLYNGNSGLNAFSMTSSGNISFAIGSGNTFDIKNNANESLLTTYEDGSLAMQGTAYVNKDVIVGGGLLAKSYDGTNQAGISWLYGNSTAYFGTSGNTIALSGSGLDLLTAVNNNGQAHISIGNSATSDYALDVTGGINASDEYAINGVGTLNNSSLTFSGATTSTISSASGQTLQLAGDGGVKIGDGTATGEPTLLTVDKSSTTPTASGDAALGSMYYDTTIGKLQCYEADGWGACSSRPDTFVSLSPEYSNAVTNGSGIGTLNSDICSDDLNINDGSSSQPTICDATQTYNFYNWTSSETTAQTKSIFVTYKLPDSFTGFVAGSTSLTGRVSTLANAGTEYQVYKNTTSGLVACGASQAVSSENTWQKVTATGSADPSTCGFSAGDSIVFKVTLSSTSSAHAYASTLGFAFSDD